MVYKIADVKYILGIYIQMASLQIAQTRVVFGAVSILMCIYLKIMDYFVYTYAAKTTIGIMRSWCKIQ